MAYGGTTIETEESVIFFRRKFKNAPKPFRRYTDPAIMNEKTVEQKFSSALMGDFEKMLPGHSKPARKSKDTHKSLNKNLFVNVKKDKLKIFDAGRGFSQPPDHEATINLKTSPIKDKLFEILSNLYKKNGMVTMPEFDLACQALENESPAIRKIGTIILSMQINWSKNCELLLARGTFVIVDNFVVLSNRNFRSTYNISDLKGALNKLDLTGANPNDNEQILVDNSFLMG
jgi:hypothetical protein